MKYIEVQEYATYNVIKMQREKAMNALNEQMLQELSDAVRFSGKQEKHIIISGYGEVFCAGGDLKLMQNIDNEKEAFAVSEYVQAVMQEIEDYPLVSIAAVNGLCYGGGVELALSCDFIFAGENAVFSMPELNYDIIPGGGGTVRLVKKISYSKALDLLLTAKQLEAYNALKSGLADKVFASEKLLQETESYLKSIKTENTEAISLLKQSFKSGSYKTEAVNFASLLLKYGKDKMLF